MSGAFSLKSYELDEADIHMLERLTNPSAQAACIAVYAQGFLAARIRVNRWRDRFFADWNNLVGKMLDQISIIIKRFKPTYTFKSDGLLMALYKPSLSFQFDCFLKSLHKMRIAA